MQKLRDLKNRFRIWRLTRLERRCALEEADMMELAGQARKCARTWQRRKHDTSVAIARLRGPYITKTWVLARKQERQGLIDPD